MCRGKILLMRDRTEETSGEEKGHLCSPTLSLEEAHRTRSHIEKLQSRGSELEVRLITTSVMAKSDKGGGAVTILLKF